MRRFGMLGFLLPMTATTGLISLVGCAPYQHKTPEYRIKPFYKVLNDGQKTRFEQAEFEALAKNIEAQLQADDAFKKQWKAVMAKEAIPFFSVEDQLKFFHEQFYSKLKTQ